MSVLICGSFAYDTIMLYPGHFRNEILPDKVHILNVSFQVPKMRREYGGCAGNIAYTLKNLGAPARPMGTAGRDFGAYAAWLERNGIDAGCVKQLNDEFTAQAYIITDLDDNQITAFHPGAMNRSHEQKVVTDGMRLGCVSPDGRDGMLQHAQQFADAGIPFLFDPGQGMPLFDGEELKRFLDLADYVALNDYESEMLTARTGLNLLEAASRVKALIVTRGGKGSHIYVGKKLVDIPAAKPDSVTDPTGCGDAYRGGLLYGLLNGMDWETTGRIASLCGAIKVACAGTQNHVIEPESFRARFKSEFGYDFM
jgi:adenosine kinase